jgi:hypothetical protein
MAGGEGQRLRPLTEKTPKPLLKVGDKPIIEHTIDRLAFYGLKNMWLSVNYLANQMEEFVSDKISDISIQIVKESIPLGTIGSITLIDSFYNERVAVLIFAYPAFSRAFPVSFPVNALLGADMAAKATPDGYTWLAVTLAHAVNQSLFNNLPYSLEKNLVPVTHLATSPLVLVVNESNPAKTPMMAITTSNSTSVKAGCLVEDRFTKKEKPCLPLQEGGVSFWR